MPKDYDLIVVGAGPAGSTLAGLVKKYNPGARVLIVEKSAFPRHRIGESLLPGSVPVLKELGVYDKINSEGFPRKIGVVFVWGKDRKPWDADFNNLNLEMIRRYGRTLDTEFSWQVLRSRYDQILLEHARSLGVEVLMETSAVEPITEGTAVRGVAIRGSHGGRRELRCRLLADCSGQAGFLAALKRTRAYRPDLKNVAAYAYFRGARWKYRYQGHPDKTKIFVCSVPAGWFWYIPLSPDMVSVGLVAKADHVRRRPVRDMRSFFMKSLQSCREIWPLLKDAHVLKGLDPADAEKDFFTAADWSYLNSRACGEGWLAAGDSAFFIDPLLSSGVMMAHLSGHRAAYTLNTAWRQEDPDRRRELWDDYDRFCKEVGGSFLGLARYWYRHDPHARRWWGVARRALAVSSPLDLDDKLAFVAVASGLTYYFERLYTSQTLAFGSSGTEHPWQWEGTKLELKRWTRQILAIVETGFLKRPVGAGARRRRRLAALRGLRDAWVPRWRVRPETAIGFLPSSSGGLLRPIRRVRFAVHPAAGAEADAANPRRLLPGCYLRMFDLIDGRRSVGAIREDLARACDLPREVLDSQLFRILKDLAVLEVLSLRVGPAAGVPAAWPPGREDFRLGEAALRAGDPAAAHASLSRALGRGLRAPWAFALRGEARRHLKDFDGAASDLDAAVRLLEEGAPAPSDLLGLEDCDAQFERDCVRDRVYVLRAKLRLARDDIEGAHADARAALESNPRQSEALLVRAKAARALGRPQEAKRDLEAALAIESTGAKGEA